MKRVHLVQLGRVQRIEGKTGLDGIINYEYMGASEFEWGALPESLRQIRGNAKGYVTKGTGLKAKNGRELMLLCKPEDFGEVLAFLKRNAEKQVDRDLHEGLRLAEGLRCEEGAPEFWWDIDNHWMAVLGQKSAKVVFEIALTKKA